MPNQALIPVFTGKISGVSTQFVEARTLHTFLESKQHFTDWIKNRIKDFDFDENADYTVHKIMTQYNQIDRIEYHLTLDMAKELSMVERNTKGKQARCYFIECEKRLMTGLPEFLKPITETITIEDFNWRKQILCDAFETLEKAHVLMTITVSGAELLAGKCLER